MVFISEIYLKYYYVEQKQGIQFIHVDELTKQENEIPKIVCMLHSSSAMSKNIILPTLMGICDENVTKRYYANDTHKLYFKI